MLFPSSGVLLCSRVIADDDYTLYFKKLDGAAKMTQK